MGSDVENSYNTLLFRTYLYQGYFPTILKSVFGKGIGAPMYFYNEELRLATWTETLAVDSTLVTVGYKGGLLLLLIYSFMIFFIIFAQIKMYVLTKKIDFLVLLIVFAMFLFSTCIITAQTIHTFTINAFFVLIFLQSIDAVNYLKIKTNIGAPIARS